eukprot:gnl/TRDRNA2_/TRDRNA2_87143_c0_seq1.p1 gnl/TRDRNA2_/TRDRNA2_87143_c0~~gnl/TRDRNA2_/TRDRNA2_87143_c0_seq1.p1  ORF type:complete len:413 (-),score=64.13 gnl/TRDRNA2_/TRDRNA2_87143_c0_seq1:46-1284(-)
MPSVVPPGLAQAQSIWSSNLFDDISVHSANVDAQPDIEWQGSFFAEGMDFTLRNALYEALQPATQEQLKQASEPELAEDMLPQTCEDIPMPLALLASRGQAPKSQVTRQSDSDGSESTSASGDDELRYWPPPLSTSSRASSPAGGGQERNERLPQKTAAHQDIERPLHPPTPRWLSTSPSPTHDGGVEAPSVGWTSGVRVPLSISDALASDTNADVQSTEDVQGQSESELRFVQQNGNVHMIPRNDEGEISSVGSIRHHEGDCTPCLFWFRNNCAKGVQCNYCHFRHKDQRNKRIRPSKKTRQLMREAADDAQDTALTAMQAHIAAELHVHRASYPPALEEHSLPVQVAGELKAYNTALQMKALQKLQTAPKAGVQKIDRLGRHLVGSCLDEVDDWAAPDRSWQGLGPPGKW